MGIQGSINASLAAGANQVTFPSSNLTLVAIKIVGPVRYIQIPLNASENAVLIDNGENPTHPLFRVTQVLGSNTLNVTAGAAGNVIFYYGSPLPGARPLSSLKGIVNVVSYAAGGNVQQLIQANFPGGKRNLVGIQMAGSSNAVSYQIAFATAVGENVTFQETADDMIAVEDVMPANNLPLPISLSIIVTASNTTAVNALYLALYYS